ncbi:MAG: hypothetical protein U9R15_09375 [Chloroflexota bacterium]|nr:hypothetical protein [Chloroflexota bacterium]
MDYFENKVTIVTGGASGIGRAGGVAGRTGSAGGCMRRCSSVWCGGRAFDRC